MSNQPNNSLNVNNALEDHLAKSLKGYPNNSVDWLTRLIAYDTVSRHSNMALINDVQSYCLKLGLTPVLTYNQQKTKANLFVTIAAGQKQEITSGGVVLSGHTDVVPVDGQNWLSDPFKAEIRDNKLYGRGACDMKGFIACALSLMPKAVQLAQAGKLIKPLHLALSFDEEVGCLGAPIMIDELKKRGIKPDYCIVGEPSLMRMVVAHKGISVFKCSVHGKSVHSSLTPQGVNAISYATKLISFIDELAETIAQDSVNDTMFDVPFSTLSVGTINGGTATNIVPNLCEFTFDYRNLPVMGIDDILQSINDKIAQLTQQMREIDANAGIELQQLESVPAMNDANSAELQVIIAGLVHESERHKVAYATEGGQFTSAGIATVICGPGSIQQAHKANEFIELEQLQLCDEFLHKLLATLS